MRKGLNLLVISSIVAISAASCAVRAEAAEMVLPLDMRVMLGVDTRAELDTRLKEMVVIPENPSRAADAGLESADGRYVPGTWLFPIKQQVELGMVTKEELDEAIKGKTSGPEFCSEEAVEEGSLDQQAGEAADGAKIGNVAGGTSGNVAGNVAGGTAGNAAGSVDETRLGREDYQVYSKVIMVGDSRFVGMSSVSTQPLCQWICETAKGYDWLLSEAVTAIDESIEPDCAIVINLGVNDVYRPGDYISFVNSKAEEWIERGVDVYYMSVNPVMDGYGGSVTNADVENFNNQLSEGLSSKIGYIDTCSYLMENGFATQDGLHFDADTYAAILDYCLGQLRV